MPPKQFLRPFPRKFPTSLTPIKSLWINHFEIKHRGKQQYKKLTPLLQLKQYTSYQLLSTVTKHKFYKYENMFTIYSSNISNCRRSKTINKVREMVKGVIDEVKVSGKLFSIYLNQIVMFVPNTEIEKHLRVALQLSLSKTPTSQTPHSNLPDPTSIPLNSHSLYSSIVTSYPTSPHLFQKLLSSHPSRKYSIIDHQSSNTNIILNNHYILQFHPQQKLKILRDFILLKLTLDKFNFFKFFVNYQSSNNSKGFKLGERFVKSVEFESEVTEKYLLMVLRWRNYQKVEYTIRSMVGIYEEEYKGKLEKQERGRQI